MRHRYVFATYPRAFSKSFLSILILALRAVLYPGSQLFITTGGKEQAANIAKEKVEELCKLIPGLRNEIRWGRGESKASKNEVEYKFKNGSTLSIMAASQATRGMRKTGGLIEEAILVNGDVLNEVIIPTMNVDRRLPDGTRRPEETTNKSQIYVTTAGWKASFTYDKMIEILVRQVVDPDEAICIGGTYRVPVMEGLLPKSFVEDLKLGGTYNDASFSREYESSWSGDAENAFFSADQFDRHRVLFQPEWENTSRNNKTSYYVIGVDVGRRGCNSEATVVRVTPQANGGSLKALVNLFSWEAEHFETQAINIKKLFYKYKAKKVVIDGNGLGAGLLDYMVKSQIDPETGDNLPPFGVENDPDGDYKRFKTFDTEPEAIYIMKANAPINTEAHVYVQTQLSSGKIKMLVDENQAKIKLMSTKIGQQMSGDERAQYLKPFVLTTALRAQMLNLVEQREGINIILKQSSTTMLKDKFSSFEYALYYIKKNDDKMARNKRRDMKEFMLFSSGGNVYYW